MKFYQIEDYINKNYYCTSYLGLARTVLAIGLFITLILNDSSYLFNTNIDGLHGIKVNQYNFFSLYVIFDSPLIPKIFSLIVLALVIIGFYPRYTCILHFWVTFSYMSCVHIVDGGDQIASILTILFIPICIFNPNKWHWTNYKTDNFYCNTIQFFSYLLIMIQAVVIYFHAAVGKFVVPEWINGTAIYYWFNDPVFGASGYVKYFFNHYIFKYPMLTFYMNWGAMFIELFIVIAIFLPYKKIKFTALMLGLIFHLMIVLVHGLMSFYFSMASLLIVSLYSFNNTELFIPKLRFIPKMQ